VIRMGLICFFIVFRPFGLAVASSDEDDDAGQQN